VQKTENTDGNSTASLKYDSF